MTPIYYQQVIESFVTDIMIQLAVVKKSPFSSG